jgi:large subunit ribosomal protein L30
MSAAKKDRMLKLQWTVSFIGCTRDMLAAIRGLGFRRLEQIVERPDTPAIRGMVRKVRHLVKVVGEN